MRTQLKLTAEIDIRPNDGVDGDELRWEKVEPQVLNYLASIHALDRLLADNVARCAAHGLLLSVDDLKKIAFDAQMFDNVPPEQIELAAMEACYGVGRDRMDVASIHLANALFEFDDDLFVKVTLHGCEPFYADVDIGDDDEELENILFNLPSESLRTTCDVTIDAQGGVSLTLAVGLNERAAWSFDGKELAEDALDYRADARAKFARDLVRYRRARVRARKEALRVRVAKLKQQIADGEDSSLNKSLLADLVDRLWEIDDTAVDEHADVIDQQVSCYVVDLSQPGFAGKTVPLSETIEMLEKAIAT